MTENHMLIALSVGIVILISIAALVLLYEARQYDVEARVIRTVGDDTSSKLSDIMVTSLHGFGNRFRRFYSPTNLEHLRSVIVAAGLNPRRTLPLVLGGKIVLMVMVPLLAMLVAVLFVQSMPVRLAIGGIGVIAGILGPEMILNAFRRQFAFELERGIPDALDLLIICTEAGMGLESALERVASGMHVSNRAMATILDGLLDDLRMSSQHAAFTNLGTRSGSDGLRRVSTMLSQSVQYGTPFAQSLRNVAAELRTERANNLEEKAVKLGTKLVFPMLGFIFPTLLVVLLGTSFLSLFDSLQPVLATIQ